MPIERDSDQLDPSSEIAKLRQRLSGFETEQGRLHGLQYTVQPNDVGISTTPKAGTTWMQQICHQLRCAKFCPEKCMEFDEISRVVPWIELAYDQHQTLSDPQTPTDTIRFFKTHFFWDHCPKFPKTIVVLRDPYDVLLSFYKFFEGWFFEPGTISLDDFGDQFWLARGVPTSKMENASYFVHLISWYQRRHDEDSVLLVCFEDLKDDLEGQVQRIAAFLSNDEFSFEEEQIIQQTVARSSFKFMKQHEDQFDEKLSKMCRNKACGLPKDAGMNQSKVNKGKVAAHIQELSDEMRAKIDAAWNETVEPVTGAKNYNQLRARLTRHR